MYELIDIITVPHGFSFSDHDQEEYILTHRFRTKLRVLIPLAAAICITAWPTYAHDCTFSLNAYRREIMRRTALLAPFWTIQSPSLRSTKSRRTLYAVGGLTFTRRKGLTRLHSPEKHIGTYRYSSQMHIRQFIVLRRFRHL